MNVYMPEVGKAHEYISIPYFYRLKILIKWSGVLTKIAYAFLF